MLAAFFFAADFAVRDGITLTQLINKEKRKRQFITNDPDESFLTLTFLRPC